MEYKCSEKDHLPFRCFSPNHRKTVLCKTLYFLNRQNITFTFSTNKMFKICIGSLQTWGICLHWWKIKWKHNYAGGSLGVCLVRGFLAFLPHFSSSRNTLFETQNIEAAPDIKNQTTSEISNYISHLVNSNSETV